jgi:hypothetical protein
MRLRSKSTDSYWQSSVEHEEFSLRALWQIGELRKSVHDAKSTASRPFGLRGPRTQFRFGDAPPVLLRENTNTCRMNLVRLRFVA